MHFDHEKLIVNQRARQLNRTVHEVLGLIDGNAESRQNLARAAKSVSRNIAEGAGRWRVPDKVRFYHIARASATECAASLDELVDWGLMREPQVLVAKGLAAEVVALLIVLIRSLEQRGDRSMSKTE